MPQYIRRLPTISCSPLIDPKTIPQNQALYNPSRADDDVYIRGTVYTPTNEMNHMLFFNVKTKESREINSPYNLLKKTVNLFQGIEDLRICRYKERVWFTATSTHASDDMTNVLLVGFMDPTNTSVEFLQKVDIGSLPVKNVCPFVYPGNGKLRLLDIYLSKVYEIDEVAEETKPPVLIANTVTNLQRAPGIIDTKLRGSTSPVHLHGNIWGCVVHDIIFNDNRHLITRLAYMHHWMEFDVERGIITYISTPFFIHHWGVEYVSGIHLPDEKNKDRVLLYFGIQDKVPMQALTRLCDLRCGR